jgi:HEAT repeat protein
LREGRRGLPYGAGWCIVTGQSHPDSERRLIEELVAAALVATGDEAALESVPAFSWQDNEAVLRLACRLSQSACSTQRQLAARILGELGQWEPAVQDASISVLSQMLGTEDDPAVLRAILIALGRLGDVGVISTAGRFVEHLDPRVRYGVTHALLGQDDPRAIALLVRLTSDVDADVRDWATLGIGTLSELDTPEIRSALAARLSDPHDDTRGEALMGLARRKYLRVVPALVKELSSDCVGTLAVEAAEEIGAAELRSVLVKLQDWWDVDPELLKRAIAACEPG